MLREVAERREPHLHQVALDDLALDITKDTSLEVKTDGEALIIRPVRLTKKERVRGAGKRMMATHAETLRKLAK